MKYVLYKSQGKISRDMKKHELIGVEFGKDVFSIQEQIQKDIIEDLSESEETANAKNVRVDDVCVAELFGPCKKYQYGIKASYLIGAKKYKTIEFGIKELEE